MRFHERDCFLGTSAPPAQVAFTPLTSQALVLAPNALSPGATYAFLLSAFDSYGAGRATISVPVSRAPRGVGGSALGSLAVSPLAGAALGTSFQFSASGWLDEDGPLSYQYQYLLPGSASPVALSAFRTDYESAAFQLPGADPVLPSFVIVQLRVQNVFGVVSIAPVNATVSVSWTPGSYSVRGKKPNVGQAGLVPDAFLLSSRPLCLAPIVRAHLLRNLLLREFFSLSAVSFPRCSLLRSSQT